MRPFLYRCPNTGFRVQGLDPEDKSEAGDAVIIVTCTACGRMHLVNPKSGETRKDKE
jgi:hypothetical protein